MTIPDFEQMIAKKYASILKLPVTALTAAVDPDGYTGWRVKTVNGIHAEIWQMLFTWRLALVPADDYYQADVPHWCFEGDAAGLALAMGYASTYGAADWKPAGYTRALH